MRVTKCPTEKTDSFWISADLKASSFSAGPVEQWYPDYLTCTELVPGKLKVRLLKTIEILQK
jgi:hypothetical protein